MEQLLYILFFALSGALAIDDYKLGHKEDALVSAVTGVGIIYMVYYIYNVA